MDHRQLARRVRPVAEGEVSMRRLSATANMLNINRDGYWMHGVYIALIPGDKRRILNNDKPVAPHAGRLSWVLSAAAYVREVRRAPNQH